MVSTEVEFIVKEVGFRVYSSVIEVEFNQGLLQCDYSSLAEAV